MTYLCMYILNLCLEVNSGMYKKKVSIYKCNEMGKTGFAALDQEQTPCAFTTRYCNADLPTKSSKMNFVL